MREILKNISESEYWVYGLREEDLDYTFRLAKEFADAKNAIYRIEEIKVRKETPELANDILDDAAYYTYVNIQYIWHFCIWRLQGIFEGLITNSFLPSKPDKPLRGIKAKLDQMRKSGFNINQDDYDELILWARLRNALSHVPPEQYRPGPLSEEDVSDYLALLKRVCSLWRSQNKNLESSSQAKE